MRGRRVLQTIAVRKTSAIPLAASIALALSVAGFGCKSEEPPASLVAQGLGALDAGKSSHPAPPDVAAPPADAERRPSGLASKVLLRGAGKEHPGPNDSVKVTFVGWTPAGALRTNGEAVSFRKTRLRDAWMDRGARTDGGGRSTSRLDSRRARAEARRGAAGVRSSARRGDARAESAAGSCGAAGGCDPPPGRAHEPSAPAREPGLRIRRSTTA